MRILILAIFVITTLIACRSAADRKAQLGQPVTSEAQLKSLTGTWVATAETFEMLAKKKYARDTVYLELRPDSSFKAHLPDCLDAANKGGLILDAIGTWKLRQLDGSWKLSMAFVPGRLFRYRTFTTFDFVRKDTVIYLVREVGNPEKEQLLVFRKTPY